MLSLYEYQKTNNLMIAAHRGSSELSTENTLASFAEAIDIGVKIIELDIQLTSDEQIVVFHDFQLPNSEKKISELNYNEIKNLEIGKQTNSKYNSTHIPLLEDVIKLVKDKCYLMIEIKDDNNKQLIHNISNIISLIAKYNYEANTIFGSFNYDILRKLKEINPKVYTSAIKIPNDNRLPSELRNLLNIDAYICSLSELNSAIEQDTIRNEIFLGVYGINDEKSLKEILKYKVRAIASNTPDKIIKLLNSKYS